MLNRLKEKIIATRAVSENARETVAWIIGRRATRSTPSPEKLDRLINQFLVPAWKAVGFHDALVALEAGNFRMRGQVDGCLAEARDEVATRSRSVMLLRDVWKKGGCPGSGSEIAGAMSAILGPFYMATGAVAALELAAGWFNSQDSNAATVTP